MDKQGNVQLEDIRNIGNWKDNNVVDKCLHIEPNNEARNLPAGRTRTKAEGKVVGKAAEKSLNWWATSWEI
jgi:hypothetical protein